MRRTKNSEDYKTMLELLRAARVELAISQSELAKRMKLDQSAVSKFEKGIRHLDVIGLREWLSALGVSFPQFSSELDRVLDARAAVRRQETRKKVKAT